MYPLPVRGSLTVWGLQVPGTQPLPRDGSFFFFHGAGGGDDIKGGGKKSTSN